MYSSSSDLTTIMIRRMFPSWRKDVDVGGGGFGDGDNYDDGIGDLDNNDKRKTISWRCCWWWRKWLGVKLD